MSEGYKILVADDSEASLKMISEILDILGTHVELHYAKDGIEACKEAESIIPDLILMDVVMPEMNGIEATQILRNNPLTSEIPIIVLSATESLENAYVAGANDFISKPFHKFELLIKVRSAINLVQNMKEIKKQKAELELKHAEVIKQRDKISIQQKDILDDIKYSKRIQGAIFPTKEYLNELLPDNFIINVPKNIVGGDFYWAGELHDKVIIAVADCTGHGISGAFMTMAGTAFLNEILSKNIKQHAGDILFELRNLVMKLLKQKGEEGEAADGMDIALLILDKKNNLIEFAGANNPLYLIRNEELIIYKGDRMPIGIHILLNRPFENQTIETQFGDTIYLFTDGYADQFGGPRNKKYRYNQFQNKILEIHKLPLEKQKEDLLRTLIDWKGKNQQVDDIMIVGFKI
jgi:sigma-B regulation protein RsbU (phosphoserine phosphatase)